MKRCGILIKSYHKDIHRLEFLFSSIRSGNVDAIPVYLIVPRKDYSLFRSLLFPGVEIVFEEELILERYAQAQSYTDNYLRYIIRKTPLLRRVQRKPCYFGSLVQQLCKIALPVRLENEVEAFILLDSDVVFLRSFGEGDFLNKDGPILVQENMGYEWEDTHMGAWIKAAKRTLGVEETPFEPLNHIHLGTCWKSSTLAKMARQIENINQCHWQDALMSCRPQRTWVKEDWKTDFFSEAELYGIYHHYFVERKQPIQRKPKCLMLWSRPEFNAFYAVARKDWQESLRGYLLLCLQKEFLTNQERSETLNEIAKGLGQPEWFNWY